MPVADVAWVLVVKLDWPRTSDAASPVVNPEPLRNSRTRLFAASATHRFPEESKARKIGSHMPVADVEHVLVVKLDWPRTSDAASPVVRGARYSVTRLLLHSATQRLPEESKAMPVGPFSPVDVTADEKPVKPDWPSTRVAAWSVVIALAISGDRLIKTHSNTAISTLNFEFTRRRLTPSNILRCLIFLTWGAQHMRTTRPRYHQNPKVARDAMF